MKLFKAAVLVFLVLIMPPVFAVETGTALKADAIKKEPFSDAKTIATLKVGEKVSILKKDGGWLSIKSAQGNGWVRMLSIRRGDAKKAKGVAESFKGLATGRTGTGQVVATTGIRGLNEEELKSAKFDANELNLAESFMTSRAEAQSFANQGKLKPLSLEYLPLPK
jgi:Bacterial SH3 domain